MTDSGRKMWGRNVKNSAGYFVTVYNLFSSAPGSPFPQATCLLHLSRQVLQIKESLSSTEADSNPTHLHRFRYPQSDSERYYSLCHCAYMVSSRTQWCPTLPRIWSIHKFNSQMVLTCYLILTTKRKKKQKQYAVVKLYSALYLAAWVEHCSLNSHQQNWKKKKKRKCKGLKGYHWGTSQRLQQNFLLKPGKFY